MRGRTRLGWAAVVAMAVVAVGLAVPAGAVDPATYEVTITDLTSGQPLTPPVVATHGRGLALFRVGKPATFEVKEIAENGNNAPLLAALGADPRVFESLQAGAGPLVPPGTPGSAMFGTP